MESEYPERGEQHAGPDLSGEARVVDGPARYGHLEPDHRPERPGEVRRIALDCTRAREVLGWEARVGLEDGITQTLESVR